MSVLTLAGKPIDWANPPAPTTRVMWSQRTSSGRAVTGSLRTIAFIDHLSTLAMKRFGKPLVVIQPPFNTGVEVSEGTHDFDACFDWIIPGVPGLDQQRFARANGMADWWRRPPAFTDHQHGFPLPPPNGGSPNDDFKASGFKVGKFVDGGISLFGRAVGSSQIHDYYSRRTGLSGHAHDPSWFPAETEETIFDLNAYIERHKPKGKDVVVNISSHGPLARLGGDAGQALWDEWEARMRERATARVRSRETVLIASDTNKHGALPDFGRGLRRIGGRGTDLIAVRLARSGATVKVLRCKRVDLHIDGHDAYGSKVLVTFPSGRKVRYWDVQANLGRNVTDEVFRDSCERIRKAFGKKAVYNFNEIDEADKPREHPILREVFPPEDFRAVGWGTLCPTLVGRKNLRVVSSMITLGSPGLAKVSPPRVIVETTLAPK